MRLISLTYFPYEEDHSASEFLRSKIAEYQHFWVRQGRFALISTDVDPQSLFDAIKPFLGEFDTLVISKVIHPICFAARDSHDLWEWVDRFSSPY